MPYNVHVCTSINMPGNTLAQLEGYYECRDGWIGDIGTVIERWLPFDKHTMLYLLRKSGITADVGVTLYPTTTDDEARTVADDVLARYADGNERLAYSIDDSFDVVLQTDIRVLTFTGSVYVIAAAWWFMLCERLRYASGGTTVTDILANSDKDDDSSWYEPIDRGKHMILWAAGPSEEPSPFAWIVENAGPLWTKAMRGL